MPTGRATLVSFPAAGGRMYVYLGSTHRARSVLWIYSTSKIRQSCHPIKTQKRSKLSTLSNTASGPFPFKGTVHLPILYSTSPDRGDDKLQYVLSSTTNTSLKPLSNCIIIFISMSALIVTSNSRLLVTPNVSLGFDRVRCRIPG